MIYAIKCVNMAKNRIKKESVHLEVELEEELEPQQELEAELETQLELEEELEPQLELEEELEYQLELEEELEHQLEEEPESGPPVGSLPCVLEPPAGSAEPDPPLLEEEAEPQADTEADMVDMEHTEAASGAEEIVGDKPAGSVELQDGPSQPEQTDLKNTKTCSEMKK